MKKFALTAVLALALMPSAQASTRMVVTPKCEEPVPVRSYESDAMVYGVSIDLSGCSWWNGSPIQLVASVSRLDGAGEEGTTTGTVCGGWPARPGDDGHGRDQDEPGDEDPVDDADEAEEDAGEAADSKDERGRLEQADDEGEATGGERPGEDDAEGRSQLASASRDRFTCEVSTALEHPSAELALYRGEVTYPWQDGPKTVGFSAYCASPGGLCRDGQ